MATVDIITVELSAKPKWWFAPAFYSAYGISWLVSLASVRLAERLADTFAHFLANFAHTIEARLAK